MCFLFSRDLEQGLEERERAFRRQAARAAAGVARGEAPPLLPRLSGGDALSPLLSDSLHTPLLHSIPEDAADASANAALPPQQLEELPDCVQSFLSHAVRSTGQTYRLFTLTQLVGMKSSARGRWKHGTATRLACPLEPAFVFRVNTDVLRLITGRAFVSYVDGVAHSVQYIRGLWSSTPAKSSGRETGRAQLLRWLAEAPCFPTALLPSSFLRWEEVKGRPDEAEAILSYGGFCIRATFTFDRFHRVARMRCQPGGKSGSAHCRVNYSGHMLFGLTPQGPVIHEEIATQSGVFIPTSLEICWVLPDGTTAPPYLNVTVAKVTAE